MRFLLPLLLFSAGLVAQITDPKATEFYEPIPPKVQSAAVTTPPPSDAIVLLGENTGLKAWMNESTGGDAEWVFEDGVMTVKPGTGYIKTRDSSFTNVQLHIEWRSPNEPDKEGQGRGNSGVFLNGIYEVQVLESNGSDTYTNGQAASIYKQTPPLVNATSVMGDWNSYDILFTAPVFDRNGMLVRPAYITVLHNGVVVQNHFELRGDTPYIGLPKYTAHGPGSIKLQDHSNEVSYRNIWIRRLD